MTSLRPVALAIRSIEEPLMDTFPRVLLLASHLEMKELPPTIRCNNLLNFPTGCLLANASFPKLPRRVIAAHHLEFPLSGKHLPNTGNRCPANSTTPILRLHKEFRHLKDRAQVVFCSPY